MLTRGPFPTPIERALWAGRLSLCATEAGGAHPRQTATTLALPIG